MPYSILSAQYANPEHTAAVVMTQEAGAVLLSEADTPSDWAAMLAWGTPAAFAPPAPTSDAVDAERDRRIAALFVFAGKAYQLDPESQINMTAMGASARFAIGAGAVAGNLRWSDPNSDFGWIATDNSITPLDAPTMAALADAALAWKSANVFAARAIKNIAPIPADYAADVRWPPKAT